jgi:hypothetical protein
MLGLSPFRANKLVSPATPVLFHQALQVAQQERERDATQPTHSASALSESTQGESQQQQQQQQQRPQQQQQQEHGEEQSESHTVVAQQQGDSRMQPRRHMYTDLHRLARVAKNLSASLSTATDSDDICTVDARTEPSVKESTIQRHPSQDVSESDEEGLLVETHGMSKLKDLTGSKLSHRVLSVRQQLALASDDVDMAYL